MTAFVIADKILGIIYSSPQLRKCNSATENDNSHLQISFWKDHLRWCTTNSWIIQLIKKSCKISKYRKLNFITFFGNYNVRKTDETKEINFNYYFCWKSSFKKSRGNTILYSPFPLLHIKTVNTSKCSHKFGIYQL